MTAFLLAFVLVFLTSLGGRDQLLVARLRSVLGPSGALLAVALVCAAATAALAAVAGAMLARSFSEDGARMFVAIALLFAAAELARKVRMSTPDEPTRSLGAIALVLGARQIGDAARFTIVALAAMLAAPRLAGLGGAMGGAAALWLAWALGKRIETRLPLAMLRRTLAVILAAAAIGMALTARGIIG